MRYLENTASNQVYKTRNKKHKLGLKTAKGNTKAFDIREDSLFIGMTGRVKRKRVLYFFFWKMFTIKWRVSKNNTKVQNDPASKIEKAKFLHLIEHFWLRFANKHTFICLGCIVANFSKVLFTFLVLSTASWAIQTRSL